jgi:hypothetical protein
MSAGVSMPGIERAVEIIGTWWHDGRTAAPGPDAAALR